MELEDILTCSHKTVTGHYPESLLITIIPFTFSHYIYLLHFNIIFQSTWSPLTYFLKFFDHTLYNTFLANLALTDLITIICCMVKGRNFEAPLYEIFLASCSFLSLGLSVVLSNSLPNMPTSFPSFSVTNQVHTHRQREIKLPCRVLIPLIS
jgi:hypothetical protein